MNKYENVSGVDQSLVGYGVIKAGAIVEVPFLIENPNFKPVGEVSVGQSVVATAAPQSNALTDAAPIADITNSEEEA